MAINCAWNTVGPISDWDLPEAPILWPDPDPQNPAPVTDDDQ